MQKQNDVHESERYMFPDRMTNAHIYVNNTI